MPVTYQFVDDNKEGAVIRAVGDVTGDEFINTIREIFNDEESIKKYKYGLVDYSQLDTFDISMPQIRELANFHIQTSKINSNIIVGFAINNKYIYGLVRVWMAYASVTGWQVNIKQTVPEIRNWIEERLVFGKEEDSSSILL